jgi:hypothetical protein
MPSAEQLPGSCVDGTTHDIHQSLPVISGLLHELLESLRRSPVLVRILEIPISGYKIKAWSISFGSVFVEAKEHSLIVLVD